MSIIPSGTGRTLPFYITELSACPYLPDRAERKLFTRLTGNQAVDAEINAVLARAGFRRSHDIVYRPACPDCNACVPVRIPVDAFTLSRSLRRIATGNRDLIMEATNTPPTDALYALFMDYQTVRHADGEMELMTADDFAAMLGEGGDATRIYLLRDGGGELYGCMIADDVRDGLSAVYSFFRPDLPRRSLGTQLVISLVEEAKRLGLPYVYLGYWIKEARNMAYKGRFKPLQVLGVHGWSA